MVKIGYLADGPWAHEALDRMLADRSLSVEFIVPRFANPDTFLQRRADDEGIDFIPLRNINSADSRDRIAGYGVDVLVSMSFDQIFRREILELAPMGILNCHAGELPFYRGRNVLNWALINDEDQFGVTVHYVDEGIDTGDIVIQRFSPITDSDSYRTLLDRAVIICADALHEALTQLRDGKIERVRQSTVHPVGSYTGRRVDGDEWIDWNWSSRRIFNFVRALSSPGPGAKTSVDGTEVAIFQAQLVPHAPSYIATVGEVVGQFPGGVHVKTGDSFIALTDWETESDRSFRIGTRFQTQTQSSLQNLRGRIQELERALIRDEAPPSTDSG